MHYLRTLGCVAALLGSVVPQTALHARPASSISIQAVDTSRFPEIAVDFQLMDSAEAVPALSTTELEVREDTLELARPVSLTRQSTDASTPVVQAALVGPTNGGATSVELAAAGAAVGIVFDNTTLLNGGSRGAPNYLAAGRQMLEHMLEQPGQAPGNPEIFSLFLPTGTPDQGAQLPGLATFTADRDAVRGYLRSTPPCTGSTRLYAALHEAVLATSEAAQATGRPAVVVVVADGSDGGSDVSAATVGAEATARGVTIVALGVGSDTALRKGRGGAQLSQLATTTGGSYAPRPDDATAAALFHKHTAPRPAALYTLRYLSRVLDDGKAHSLVLRIGSGEQSRSSEPTAIFGMDGAPRPLAATLLREYVIVAVPLALLVSLLIVLITGGLRRRRGHPLSRALTVR